ncbi:PAS domain-containing protein [Adhaeribacter sp. BT258]|uniref:histidine kinase n=1 Tax=Adhaeribacter terrigena TaxID=2793070 RepID=A0ABS1C4K6_9BACT|nr:PAS domain-containing protein [Adhaeribacter terrigena]MBK0403563.1 PAS domain-containing protein [Adhaeribacter terrigena]
MDFFELFSNVPESLVVVSPEYKVLAATDAYLKVTMRTREEIVGLHFLKEAFPEKDVPYEENPVKIALDKTLQSKEVLVMDVIRYDLVIPEEEGGGYKELYWETSYIPGLDKDGNVKYIIQKAVNVTELELARQARKTSEEKFKFLTDAVPLMIHTADAEGNCTYVNQRWLDYTGLNEDALMGKNWFKVFHPEDLEAIKTRSEEALANNTELQAELRVKDKEGNYRWHLMRSTPMKDESGKVLLRVGSTYDIHSTKQMVQELLESNEQMSVLSDQLQTAFQEVEDKRQTLENLIMQVPAVINILRGPEHRFELVNPQYQRLFPNRQLLGKTTAEALPEAVEQGFIQILDNVYNTRKPFIALEMPFVSDWEDNGNVQEHYFTISYLPLIEKGEVAGIITFGYIITDKVKIRKELEALKSSLA